MSKSISTKKIKIKINKNKNKCWKLVCSSILDFDECVGR
jgi:hypothetical protein